MDKQQKIGKIIILFLVGSLFLATLLEARPISYNVPAYYATTFYRGNGRVLPLWSADHSRSVRGPLSSYVDAGDPPAEATDDDRLLVAQLLSDLQEQEQPQGEVVLIE